MVEEILNRRSIRKFTKEELTKEQITMILESARPAPSAHNRQPWSFLVLTEKQKNKIATMMIDKVLNSPTEDASIKHTAEVIMEANQFILILYNGVNKDYERDMDMQSIGAAIENMCLQATKMNIGSLWIGNTNIVKEEITSMLELTGKLVASFALGYPNQSPKQRPRKELEDIVIWMED